MAAGTGSPVVLPFTATAAGRRLGLVLHEVTGGAYVGIWSVHLGRYVAWISADMPDALRGLKLPEPASRRGELVNG